MKGSPPHLRIDIQRSSQTHPQTQMTSAPANIAAYELTKRRGGQTTASRRIVALASALFCIALLSIRTLSTIRFGALTFTSGAEDASLFAIWKWVHGVPVYQDPFSPPFAQSYFNFLFYSFYGLIAKLFTGALHFPDIALPTITRLTTLGLVTIGIVVTYLSIKSVTGAATGISHAALAVIAFTNPLVGYWAITARPDIGATVLDLAGIWLVLRSEKRQDTPGALWAIPFFYAAWAFKQTHVAGLIGCILLFAIRGRWRQLTSMVAVSAVLIYLTLAIGGPTYRYAVIASQLHMGVVPIYGMRMFFQAIVKAPLLGVGLLLVSRKLVRERTFSPMCIFLLVSIGIAAATVIKVGASDNYFIESSVLAAIVCLEGAAKSDIPVLTAGLAAQAFAVTLILLGVFGRVLPERLSELASIKQVTGKQAGTCFVTENSANLPWFQNRPPYFVLATTYFDDREAGRKFEYGGVAGMIKSGRIDTVISARQTLGKSFDGVDLRQFPIVDESDGWIVMSTAGPESRAK